MTLESIFANILDLPGVEGAALFGDEGSILHNAMPGFVGAEALAEAHRRIFAMYETMGDNFLPCEDYTFFFDGHLLVLRKAESCLLLVLGSGKLNQSSLRMVTNMALKRLDAMRAERPHANGTGSSGSIHSTPAPMMEAPSPTLPATAPESTGPGAPPREAVPVVQRKARFYRGQIYYDDE